MQKKWNSGGRPDTLPSNHASEKGKRKVSVRYTCSNLQTRETEEMYDKVEPNNCALCVICLLCDGALIMLFVARIPKHSTRGLVLWSFLNAVWFMFYEGPQHTTASYDCFLVASNTFHLPPRTTSTTPQPGKRRLCWSMVSVSCSCEGPRAHIEITRPIFLSNNLATWCEGVKCAGKQVLTIKRV